MVRTAYAASATGARLSLATVLCGPITVVPHRDKADPFRRPSILFRPHGPPNEGALVEPPGTAPGSDPLITGAFMSIVPVRERTRNRGFGARDQAAVVFRRECTEAQREPGGARPRMGASDGRSVRFISSSRRTVVLCGNVARAPARGAVGRRPAALRALIPGKGRVCPRYCRSRQPVLKIHQITARQSPVKPRIAARLRPSETSARPKKAQRNPETR